MLAHHRLQKYLRTHFALSRAEAAGTFALLVIVAALVICFGFAKYKNRGARLASEVLPADELASFQAAQLKNAKQSEAKRTFIQKNSIATTPAQVPAAHHKKTKTQVSFSAFDINTATAQELCQVKGIGEVLSARIIKFRDRLGGFISKEQYKEVYGLKPEVVEELGKCTFIHQSFAKQKIDLNTATIKSLLQHPYMTYDCAKLIVRKVERSGPFASMEEVKGFLEKNNFDKRIIPYLTLSNSTQDDSTKSARAT